MMTVGSKNFERDSPVVSDTLEQPDSLSQIYGAGTER
jgi:hypothetical protein